MHAILRGTGRGADLLIIDDIIKASDARSSTVRRAAEQFYEETLLSRLNKKTEASVIAVEREDLATLEALRDQMTNPVVKTLRTIAPLEENLVD